MRKNGPTNRKFFSVITPVHLWNPKRVEDFVRCADSLRNQKFKDFEWIVVDDGSTEKFNWSSIDDIADIVIHKEHEERVIAYNEAFKEASGEWFALLDSDDCYLPDTLLEFCRSIERSPKFKLFNCGTIYHHKDGAVSTRDPFIPKRKKVGHEIFGGGNIVNGTYIWHHSVYDLLGGYPAEKTFRDIDCSEINYGGVRDLFMGTPYDFSAYAQLEFPEIRQYFFVDHENEPNKIIKELGNPWGQDYYLFYKYTRQFHTKAIKKNLLVVYPR
jgi:glycosyltransferase involved in cell wall biosynthesis